MLNKEQLKFLLDLGLETGADFSELYFENTYSNVPEYISNINNSSPIFTSYVCGVINNIMAIIKCFNCSFVFKYENIKRRETTKNEK